MGLDALTALAFAVRASPGAFALLIGSGASSAAGIPTGWDIVVDLAKRIATTQKANAGSDPVDWYRKRYGDEADSKVVARFAKTPAERQAFLRSYIEPTDDQREAGIRVPTKAHRAIAELVSRGYIRIILTTNFDRLLEQALEARGVSFDVIDGVDALRGARPVDLTPALVVKLHGDYRDARIKNTPTELGAYEPEIEALLDRILDEHGLIVSGWSATWDTALRTAIRRQPNRRFTTYWFARGEVSAEAKELIQARAAELVVGRDAESVFTELESKVTALEEIDRPHPLSVETAVAELKRYLPDQSARIRLNDLLVDEAERVVQATGPAVLKTEGPGSAGEMTRRSKMYEAATEILTHLLAVGCAYSGGPEQDRLWSRAIERVAERPELESGMTAYIAFRRFPGVLCLYTAGIAAVAFEKWVTLKEIWLGRESTDGNGRRVPLIAALHIFMAFQDTNPQAVLYPSVVGERKFTPISDYLHDALRPALRALIPSDNRYTEAFDRYEWLTSLALSDLRSVWKDEGYIPRRTSARSAGVTAGR